MIFITFLVIVPMLILFFASSYVLNKQIQNSAQSYLEGVFKIAHNEVINQRIEMTKGCELFLKNQDVITDINNKDFVSLGNKLEMLTSIYDHINLLVFYDKDLNMLSISENINPNIIKEFSDDFEEVRLRKETISSPLIIDLDNVFLPDSSEIDKYIVKIDSENELRKALVSTAIVPAIYENDIVGYLIAGHIVNNDKNLPKIYSDNIPESFMALSIYGIRISSNIKTPIKSDFVESQIPFNSEEIINIDDTYFGKALINDEVHVFIDKPLIDYKNNLIGIIGVGIPENKFTILVDTNKSIIQSVAVFTLLLMLVFGREVSDRLTQPIEEVTYWAKEITRGNKDIKIKFKKYFRDEDETEVLLRTFQKMADDLKASEEERKKYLDELEEKHEQQISLSRQLAILNDDLEAKVEARTEDLKQAIIVLKNSDEIKTRFLANMSHELRTPLNGIIATASALREKIFGDVNDKQEKYLQNILSSSNHLLQLINDILDITKIEAGKMTLTLERYPLKEVIDDSFQIVKSMAFRKNINVVFDLVPEDFILEADPKKLKQILYNLFSNSIKFTPEGGQVTVESRLFEDFVRISVKDNGIGIREEDQERVFKEFEQVDNSYERQYEGTGLGLPLTKKLVELHGGDVFLKSKVGVGTEVTFTIPIL